MMIESIREGGGGGGELHAANFSRMLEITTSGAYLDQGGVILG